mgnify:FL=1|jgi:hypothetical protein
MVEEAADPRNEMEDFGDRDEEMMKRGEEAKRKEEALVNADYAILKKVGEDLNMSLYH